MLFIWLFCPINYWFGGINDWFWVWRYDWLGGMKEMLFGTNDGFCCINDDWVCINDVCGCMNDDLTGNCGDNNGFCCKREGLVIIKEAEFLWNIV